MASEEGDGMGVINTTFISALDRHPAPARSCGFCMVDGGEPQYTPLMRWTINGSTLVPVSFSNIEGAAGSGYGRGADCNADTQELSFGLTVQFFPLG